MIELNVQSVKEFSYSPFRSLLQKRENFHGVNNLRFRSIRKFEGFYFFVLQTKFRGISIFVRDDDQTFHRRNRCEGPRVSSFTKGEIFEISTVTNINCRHLEMAVETRFDVVGYLTGRRCLRANFSSTVR